MATPEAKVKAEIKTVLNSITAPKWVFMPFGGRFGAAGVPDFVGCIRGRFFAIEAKAESGKLTALQARCLELITKAGGLCGVVKPSIVSIEQQIQNILGDSMKGE